MVKNQTELYQTMQKQSESKWSITNWAMTTINNKILKVPVPNRLVYECHAFLLFLQIIKTKKVYII